jgi:phosphoribosylformylglycinamidine cyclo-ligase
VFTDSDTATDIVAIAASFGIEAQISGRVEAAERKEVIIESSKGTFSYT